MIKKMHIKAIREILLYMVAFALACYVYAAPVMIMLYAVAWVAEGNIRQRLLVAVKNKFVLLFCSFYLLHLIGMLYSSNMAFGWFDLQVKLSIFIFPVLLVSEGEMPFEKQKGFIMAFTSGLVVNGLICTVVALWRLLVENKLMFQYKDFSFFTHPSYFSMYIDMALVLIFYVLTEKDNMLSRKEKVFFYVSVFFLEYVLVLLQSKTGLIVSLLIFTIVILRYALRKGPWVVAIAIIVGVCSLYFISYHYIITSGRSRILSSEEILAKDTLHAGSTESTQVRLFIWKAAWNVIKQHPVGGTGTGDVKNILLQEYAKEGITGALREKLNAHNEYIQCTTAIGFVGLADLLLCLFVPMVISLKQRRFVYTMFIVIMLINFLTEAMLETQGGTMFYGLFNSLLMFNFFI